MAESKRFDLRCRLSLKGKPHHDSTENAASQKASKYVRKTNSECQKTFLENLKKNPEKYKQFRSYETLRVKVWRAELSEEKKAEQREKTRLHVAKKRANDKAKQKQKEARLQTRSTLEKQRKVWKTAQTNCRAKRTPEEHQQHLEKRRAKYHADKVKIAEKKRKTAKQSETPSPSSSGTFGTKNALKQAVKRVKARMPSTSEKSVDVITHMIRNSTPRSKEKIKRRCISPSSRKRIGFLEEMASTFKSTMDVLHKKRNKQALMKKRTLTAAASTRRKYVMQQRKVLGLGYKSIKSVVASATQGNLNQRKRRSDALDFGTVKAVERFYNRGDVSRALPDARSARKSGSSIIGRRVMEMSVSTAHEQYQKEHTDKPIGFSAFSKLQPKHVSTMDNNKLQSCLCEYCVNVDFKIQSLTTFCSVHKVGCIIKDRYDASKRTLCSRGDRENPRKICLDRKCSSCGPDKLDEYLEPLTDAYGNSNISWSRWQIGSVRYGDNMVRRMVKVRKSGSINELVEELKSELVPFAGHLFNALWQWKRYNEVSTSLPENWVVFCSDFGENYTCRSQDEAQGAHWSNVQCTVHPIVATYRCQMPECQQIVTDTLMFISDDIKHCYHAVHHVTSKAIQQLQSESVEIDKLIHFSDGAPTQYKCKVTFCDASFSTEDFGFKAERHYFGSRHGKGPCDREIGVLKKQVGIDIKARRVEVTNAKDLFEYGRDKLCRPKDGTLHLHSKRRFFYTGYGIIQRDRQERTSVKPLKGTMKIHAVRGISPYMVASRERSCFCEGCTSDTGVCTTSDLTGMWVESSLKIGESIRRVTQTGSDGGDGVTGSDGATGSDGGDGTGRNDGDDTGGSSNEVMSDGDTVNSIKDGEHSASQAESSTGVGTARRVIVDSDKDGALQASETEVSACGENIKLGDYVVVIYDNAWYPGRVTAIEDGMCAINFMAPKGNNRYIWPKDEDQQMVHVNGIFAKLPVPPNPISSRYFAFSPQLIESVNGRVKSYLDKN